MWVHQIVKKYDFKLSLNTHKLFNYVLMLITYTYE